MERRTIKIDGDEGMILSVTLVDVLRSIVGDRYKWSILWLWGVGDLGPQFSIMDLQRQVKESPNGVVLTWNELNELSRKFSQIMDVIIVGDKNNTKLRKYSTDEEMYLSCDYVIQLIDSSYWIITSIDMKMLDRMVKNLPRASFVNV